MPCDPNLGSSAFYTIPSNFFHLLVYVYVYELSTRKHIEGIPLWYI